MDEEIANVLDVKRIDGRAVRARIEAGPFEIGFVRDGKKARKSGVVRYDMQVIGHSSYLYVPSYFFAPAKDKAYQIFFPKKT